MTSRLFWTVAVLATSLVASLARATDVPGGTYDDTTWTAAGSPYTVQSHVTFPQLTIEAGTTVVVMEQVIIDVKTLTVNGTRENPVTFRPPPNAQDRWRGIYIHGTGSVTGARILNSVDGFILSNQEWFSRLTVTQTVFEDNIYAIQLSSGVLEADGILVVGSRNGVHVESNRAMARIVNSVFRSLQLPIVNGGTLTVVNSSIDGAYEAIDSYGPGPIEVRNTIISNARGVAIQAANSAAIVSSDFWHNNNNFIGFTPSSGVLSFDPKYVSDTDLHLSAGSPCIDVGSANDAPDHDLDLVTRPKGAKVDIGAYEYDAAGGAVGSGGVGGGGAGGRPAATGGAGAGSGGASGGAAGAATVGNGGRGGSAGSAGAGAGGSGGAAGGRAGGNGDRGGSAGSAGAGAGGSGGGVGGTAVTGGNGSGGAGGTGGAAATAGAAATVGTGGEAGHDAGTDAAAGHPATGGGGGGGGCTCAVADGGRLSRGCCLAALAAVICIRRRRRTGSCR